MIDDTANQDAASEAHIAQIRAALEVFAVASREVGGIWLRARAGPARDAVLKALSHLPLPLRRVHPGMPLTALTGETDLAATLTSGRIVWREGLLEGLSVVILAMAERCELGMAATIGQSLDAGRCTLVALDEGVEDEIPPEALTDRLGLFLAPDERLWRRASEMSPRLDRVAEARALLPKIADQDAARTLTEAAMALGVHGVRAPAFALRAARAAAALAGRNSIEEADLALAAHLCLSHRAKAVAETDPQESPPESDGGPSQREGGGEESERLVETARAALPQGLMSALAAGRSRMARGAGAGAARSSARKGRPMPSRPGRFDGRTRIDLSATLTAAAPWQQLRHRGHGHIRVLSSDLRLRRYRERAERILIFAVDASGSAAAARLAEAKGAVELMLAGAYASRDQVALISFRRDEAELVLPPTRSLSLTKRRLAGLPGGGGTPLAKALVVVEDVAQQAVRRGQTPALVLLTDGRANVALDGEGGRARAREDAMRVARRVAGTGLKAVALDTGRRADAWLAELSRVMGATYLPLPHADAATVSAAVGAALPR